MERRYELGKELTEAEKEIIKILDALSNESRERILAEYCGYCGGESGCQCWNDE